MGRSALLLTVVVLLAVAAAPAPAATDPAVGLLGSFREPGVLLNILPPGQGTSPTAAQTAGGLFVGDPPPHWLDQHDMYESLVRSGPGLRDDDLGRYFKRQTFRVEPRDVESVSRPREGVAIVRDRFGVPHVVGDTRADVLWGAGWLTGQDRLFAADVYRHVGRGRLSEFLGPSEANLALDEQVALVAGYSEDEMQAFLDELPDEFGDVGERALADIVAYSEGVDAFITHVLTHPQELPAEYAILQQVPKPWTPRDYVAVAVLTQGIFAVGGGHELDVLDLYHETVGRLGAQAGCELWRDLRHAQDPETPPTIDRSFETQGARDRFERCPAVLPEGTALLDPGSYEGARPVRTLRDRLAAAGIPVPPVFSNYVAVPGRATRSGHPIGIFSPQTGYFVPQILMEVALHGGGIDARGVVFPGIGAHILMGRGADFAWTATSGYADMVDTRVEVLCEPDGTEPTRESTHYLFDGECRPMYERTDRWVAKPSAGGQAPPAVIERHIRRTVHGPVWGTATVEGRPVAVASQRSTFGNELDALPFAVLVNENAIDGPQGFLDAAAYLTAAANFVYVDDAHIAAYTGALIPRRPASVHPDLPSWGTGEHEWDGFLAPDEHPHVIDPPGGWLTSWNGAPARDWYAADGNVHYGPVQRVDMLNARLEAAARRGVRHTRASLVELMEDAATVDLRGQEVLPAALDVLETDAVPDDLTRPVRILREWIAAGSMRRDRDGDGEYDAEAAVALADAWFDPLIDAVLPQLLPLEERGVMLKGRDQEPGRGGSAYWNGYYSELRRTLDMALGRSAHPYRQLRCAGTGQLGACRDAVAASLRRAVAELGDDPASWEVDEQAEMIRYQATGALGAPPMHWVNRGTFQQVVQFGTRRGARTPETSVDERRPLPTTGAGSADAALAVVAGAVLLAARRRARR